MNFRNRVKELRNVSARDLRANPKNWRLHPDQQRAAMTSILQEVGFAGTIVARETPDGLEIIDGHLRADLADDAEVPTAIVDLDDDEAAIVLATYDQVGTMALVDADKLAALLDDVDEAEDDNAEFRRMAADLHRKMLKAEKTKEDPATQKTVPGMDLEPHEHYDFLVILATSTHEWAVLLEKLKLEPVKRRGRVGVGRAIRAGKLLTLLADSQDSKKARK